MSAWFIKIFKLLRIAGNKSIVALNLSLGYLAIGLHQFFEFLSIYTGNTIIYKMGLVFSISAMYFNLKASEKLIKQRLGATLIIIMLGLLAVHIYTRTMTFENAHFYVRGFSHFYWGALWIFFFLYWNFIHFFASSNSASEGRIISRLPWAALNISFLLAAVYSYTLALIKKQQLEPIDAKSCLAPFFNFEIVFDAPSIWCFFATLQGYFLYRYIKNFWKMPIEFPLSILPINRTKALIAAAISTFVIWITLPLFSALSMKMIMK